MVCHIFVNGEIGAYTTPDSFRSQVNPTAESYIIHINSEGGDVYDGYQIGNVILNLGKPVTAIVEGLCASIATYIACCADSVVMTPQSNWVIHDPTASTSGRAQDLISAASQLLKMKNEIISRYMTKLRGKKNEQELSEAMDKETNLDANEAMAWGFADSIQEKLKAVAKIDFNKFKNMNNEKEKNESFLKELSGMISKHFGSKKEMQKPINKTAKFKAIVITLTDGTVISANTDDPNNLQGASVSAKDGSAVADGVYETTDGDELTITGGVITGVEQEAEDKSKDESEDNPTEDTTPALGSDPEEVKKLKDDIEQLKQQMKANAELNVQYKNELVELRKKTIGEKKAPVVKNVVVEKEEEEEVNGMFAAMQQDVLNAFRARKIID